MSDIKKLLTKVTELSKPAVVETAATAAPVSVQLNEDATLRVLAGVQTLAEAEVKSVSGKITHKVVDDLIKKHGKAEAKKALKKLCDEKKLDDEQRDELMSYFDSQYKEKAETKEVKESAPVSTTEVSESKYDEKEEDNDVEESESDKTAEPEAKAKLTSKSVKEAAQSVRNTMIAERAKSVKQQKAAGVALSAKEGKAKAKPKGAAKEMEKMSTSELKKIAGTKHEGLPKTAKKTVKESVDSRFAEKHREKFRNAMAREGFSLDNDEDFPSRAPRSATDTDSIPRRSQMGRTSGRDNDIPRRTPKSFDSEMDNMDIPRRTPKSFDSEMDIPRRSQLGKSPRKFNFEESFLENYLEDDIDPIKEHFRNLDFNEAFDDEDDFTDPSTSKFGDIDEVESEFDDLENLPSSNKDNSNSFNPFNNDDDEFDPDSFTTEPEEDDNSFEFKPEMSKKRNSFESKRNTKRAIRESVEPRLSFKEMVQIVKESGGQQQIDPIDTPLWTWAQRVAKQRLGEGTRAEVFAGLVYERMGGRFEMFDTLTESKVTHRRRK